jgi:ubiquinone/menaquinone biosynthesis C-methylase UbiE
VARGAAGAKRQRCGGAGHLLILVAAVVSGTAAWGEPNGRDPVAPATPAALFQATSDQSFADVEYWKKILDDPQRDTWQRPAEVVKALGLTPGMTVADLGAGTGYFMPYLAAAVGDGGTVYEVEVEPNLVVYLRERAERTEAANVVPVLTSRERPRLPGTGVDLILIADTFHHLDDRRAYLGRLRRALKSSGRIAILDWFKRPLPKGPPPEHKIAREQVIEEMTAAGYRLVEEPRILEYQYLLIFAAAGQ